jgi:DNA-binding CsgD family transcriptional regulator
MTPKASNQSNLSPPSVDNQADAYLVMTNIDPEEWCALISEERKIIGRSPDADIPLSPRFRYTSRRHAEIWVDRNKIKFRDLASRAGTSVNGVWLKDHVEVSLAVGDRIQMGGLELEVVAQVSMLAHLLAETGIGLHEAAEGDETIVQRSTAPIPVRFFLRELTPAELEVVLWISRGYLDDEELGKKLFRSPNTIRTQVSSVFRKLNVHSRAQIVSLLKRG